MKVFNGLRSYILEDETKILILNKKINIINYIDIGHFDANKVVINTNLIKLIIYGSNLVVSKLMNNEVLITGDFNKIEFR